MSEIKNKRRTKGQQLMTLRYIKFKFICKSDKCSFMRLK